MNSIKLKTRKCRLNGCGAEFQPKREWHYFHDDKCRTAYNNRKRAALIARAMKALGASERGAA